MHVSNDDSIISTILLKSSNYENIWVPTSHRNDLHWCLWCNLSISSVLDICIFILKSLQIKFISLKLVNLINAY